MTSSFCGQNRLRLYHRKPLLFPHDLDVSILEVRYLAGLFTIGKICLSKEGEEPESGRFSWIATPFLTEMVITLVFWASLSR